MGRSKLARFEANSLSSNILEPGKELYDTIKGKWNDYFGNNNNIVLEVGCGRGEYTTGLANIFPNKNFIGIDIKGARLWKGSNVAIENGYHHVAFLRAKIQNLEMYFDRNEVSEIWITFPDPRPKENEEKLRLTHHRYLEIYKNIMRPGGIVHFKTDSRSLFDYSLQVLRETKIPYDNLQFTYDLYQSDLTGPHYNIQTTFEKKYLSQEVKINYLKFKF